MRSLRNTTLAALVLMLGLAATTRAAEMDPKRVPSDALWVVHVDTAAMIDSKIGKLILEDMEPLGLGDRIDSIKAELGLDPLMDFNGITMYGTGYEPTDAVVVVEMGPTIGALEKKVTLAEGYERTSHNGYAIHSWIDNKHRRPGRRYCGHLPITAQSMNLLIFSENKANVIAALDLIARTGKTIEKADRPALMRRPGKGSFVFVAGEVTDALLEKRPGRAMLKMTKSLVYDGGEKDGKVYGRLEVTADSTENATTLFQMVQGVLAMAKLPSAEEATPINRLAGAITVSQSQATVIADFSYDSAALHKEMHTLHEMKTKLKIEDPL